MKISTACSECRHGKRKCVADAPRTACKGCVRRNLTCSRAACPGPQRTKQLHPDISPIEFGDHSHGSLLTPSLEVQENLVDLYIRYIHNKPHSLFHEPTLRQGVRNGDTSRPVLFGIFGISARFSSDPEIRSSGVSYAIEARRCLKMDLENVSLQNTQACVLIANLAGADADSNTESLFFGIANRMAEILDLAVECPTDDWIMKETKRRVWWSLFLIDRWASAGLSLQRNLYFASSTHRPQMDEELFNNAQLGDPEPGPHLWKPGLWVHMITLVRIFGHIQDHNKQIVEQGDLDDVQLDLATQHISDQFESYRQGLPERDRYSTENLARAIQAGQGRTLVALNLGYHHYCTLLYYQYLDHRRQSSPLGLMFAERCKYHASAFSDLLQVSRKTRGAEALYNIVGHMTAVSSSVLVHTMLFGTDDELPLIKHRLERNFEALVELRQYWPSLELMTERLITFQNSCLMSVRDDTHEFNKWLLSFLLQHARRLDEKATFASQSTSGSWENGNSRDLQLLERSRISERIILDAHAAFQ